VRSVVNIFQAYKYSQPIVSCKNPLVEKKDNENKKGKKEEKNTAEI